jgi:hypothetical protein
VRPLLLCLFPCCLLAAAPSGPAHHPHPPERIGAVTDDGRALSDAAQMERLAREDPVAFLGECLRRYQRDVKGYTLTLQKRERLGGKLRDREVLRVAFREEPYAVSLEWAEGARLAVRALYVRGDNGDKMLVRPRLLPLIVERDVDGDDARQSGRFFLNEFGIAAGMRRAHTDWQAAQHEGSLHVEYLGERVVEEAGGRPCHVLHRTRFRKPEHDGITEQTLFIDKDNWLQVGSVAQGEHGLIGEYYFRDIRLNPDFEPSQFTREALKR